MNDMPVVRMINGNEYYVDRHVLHNWRVPQRPDSTITYQANMEPRQVRFFRLVQFARDMMREMGMVGLSRKDYGVMNLSVEKELYDPRIKIHMKIEEEERIGREGWLAFLPTSRSVTDGFFYFDPEGQNLYYFSKGDGVLCLRMHEMMGHVHSSQLQSFGHNGIESYYEVLTESAPTKFEHDVNSEYSMHFNLLQQFGMERIVNDKKMNEKYFKKMPAQPDMLL